MIVVTDATHRYGSVEALRGVSLRVDPGQRVVILGTNGSGKSTLARLLNGSLRPSSGSVGVDGVSSPPETTRRLGELVGYVRQDPRNQIVSPVVSDEVAFGPRNLGLSRPDVLSRVDEALVVCGISRLRHQLTTVLSGGQQQLLAIGRAVMASPRLLLIDEPTMGLSPAAAREVADFLHTLSTEGLSMIWAGERGDCRISPGIRFALGKSAAKSCTQSR